VIPAGSCVVEWRKIGRSVDVATSMAECSAATAWPKAINTEERIDAAVCGGNRRWRPP